MGTVNEELAEKLYAAILRCTQQADPYSFCGQIVKELHPYIYYDQARILFLDISGKISGSMLYGVSQKTWENFMEYYQEDLAGSRYSLKKPLHLSEKEKIAVCDWTEGSERRKTFSPFEREYVRPLQLTYCLGIGLSDRNHCIRGIITLDRIKKIPYSEDEIHLIRAIHPILENFFMALLQDAPGEFSAVSFLKTQFQLTRREDEIVMLLCNGMTPKGLAGRLNISLSTVYRHIANIYQKCSITNRQELFALFAGRN